VFKLTPPAVAGRTWAEAVLYRFSSAYNSGNIASIQDIYLANVGSCDGTYTASTNTCSNACIATYSPYCDGGAFGDYQTCLNNVAASCDTGMQDDTEQSCFASAASTETQCTVQAANTRNSAINALMVDGASPHAGLISDQSGALYGTTAGGGANGHGTVFKLTPPSVSGGAWTEPVLYSFTGDANPSVLIFDASGALYGMTLYGGASSGGTVFQLRPPSTPGGNWTETLLYSFSGGSDGARPEAGLILDATGALYGTTLYGGVYNIGTVYKLTPPTVAGGLWTETVLYRFGSTVGDGAFPLSSLLFDASGALYGTTGAIAVGGGGGSGNGTVFKLLPPTATSGKWTETVLHNFSGGDGAQPEAGLIADASGALYGTTNTGGSASQGTVFQLTLPAIFTGIPGKANCTGQSISFMAKKYGGIAHAAESLGYPNVAALQNAVLAYCGG
jgi:uncharacterized repeat protein (TIGR03803 family)